MLFCKIEGFLEKSKPPIQRMTATVKSVRLQRLNISTP